MIIEGRNKSGSAVQILVATSIAGNLPTSVSIQAGLSPLIVNNANFVTTGSGVWEAERGAEVATLFASAVRSATSTSGNQTNINSKGLMFTIDVTNVPGSGSTTLALVLQGQDTISSNFFEIFRSAQFSATGTYAVTICPGISASANGIASPIPRVFRILAAVSAGATSKDITFSIGVNWLP